ncbi:MAG TPA: 3-hydroxyacyl-CoA dehydrogenase/enoyl-CoA hydratase family protein [Terriglobales bacterium]|nr:3-hydroxyacyl-CoA dehydrogenase/enoyl-CoA hydratase family protein [Terriglobales bacterium]
MREPLQRVVVLGAGTMGARLAAHCANHSLDVHLLDVTREQAAAGWRTVQATRPAALFLPEYGRQVTTGSFDDGAAALGRADWVVEAVVEDLSAKRTLLASIGPQVGTHTLITTNTSGLPVATVGAALSPELQKRWWGTHFFNPPRYMRLVEVIPTAASDPELVAWLSGAIEQRLGKGVVMARDTPNFIANRIGVFALLNTLRLMREMELSVEEVDALTGPLLGWPKSATFRTLDMIGLDTLAKVVENSYRNLAGDEHRALFQVPDYIQRMIAQGWLGEKTGQGFYRREGDEILALDLQSFTYRPRKKPRHAFDDPRAAYQANAFVRQSLDGLFSYAQARLGEITDSRHDIDRAMRWGYNWQHGPFELQTLIATGSVPQPALGATVKANPACSLLDLGEGVGCLEFHNKMNVIGADTVALVTAALTDTQSPFDAFVISNGGENFSAGADLLYLLATIQNEDWDEVEQAVTAFQAMTSAVKRSPRPVIVAPFGLTLGGGCELMLHAAQIVAHAELYSGLVEVGVGLIPAGGGTKEMALRSDPRTAFETIAMARVSTSAADARKQRFLRRGDAIIANRDRVLAAARQAARSLADAGYEPPAPATLTAPGPSVISTLELGAYLMLEAQRISHHDYAIAKRLLNVIGGAGAPEGASIPEARLLELEREAFLSLCGEPKTQARIAQMLRTGKPLRN